MIGEISLQAFTDLGGNYAGLSRLLEARPEEEGDATMIKPFESPFPLVAGRCRKLKVYARRAGDAKALNDL